MKSEPSLEGPRGAKAAAKRERSLERPRGAKAAAKGELARSADEAEGERGAAAGEDEAEEYWSARDEPEGSSQPRPEGPALAWAKPAPDTGADDLRTLIDGGRAARWRGGKRSPPPRDHSSDRSADGCDTHVKTKRGRRGGHRNPNRNGKGGGKDRGGGGKGRSGG